MSYIYCITNNVNNKQYIGKTNLSIEKRFKEHCSDSTKERCDKRPLYKAMNKYGIKNFTVREVLQCRPEETNFYEAFFIQYFNTYGRNGYNATKGGDGKILFDYKQVVDLYVKEHLTKKQISAKLGCCADTVKNILDTLNIDVESRKAYSKSKQIEQYTLDNQYMNTFSSCGEAARYICDTQNISFYKSMQSKISWAARGIRKTAFGYIWKFKEEN